MISLQEYNKTQSYKYNISPTPELIDAFNKLQNTIFEAETGMDLGGIPQKNDSNNSESEINKDVPTNEFIEIIQKDKGKKKSFETILNSIADNIISIKSTLILINKFCVKDIQHSIDFIKKYTSDVKEALKQLEYSSINEDEVIINEVKLPSFLTGRQYTQNANKVVDAFTDLQSEASDKLKELNKTFDENIGKIFGKDIIAKLNVDKFTDEEKQSLKDAILTKYTEKDVFYTDIKIEKFLTTYRPKGEQNPFNKLKPTIDSFYNNTYTKLETIIEDIKKDKLLTNDINNSNNEKIKELFAEFKEASTKKIAQFKDNIEYKTLFLLNYIENLFYIFYDNRPKRCEKKYNEFIELIQQLDKWYSKNKEQEQEESENADNGEDAVDELEKDINNDNSGNDGDDSGENNKPVDKVIQNGEKTIKNSLIKKCCEALGVNVDQLLNVYTQIIETIQNQVDNKAFPDDKKEKLKKSISTLANEFDSDANVGITLMILGSLAIKKATNKNKIDIFTKFCAIMTKEMKNGTLRTFIKRKATPRKSRKKQNQDQNQGQDKNQNQEQNQTQDNNQNDNN